MLLDFDDDGPGPVVVLLHGFPLDRTMWSFQRSSVGSIYRLITPDLRGHGHSAAPEGVYSVDAMADDVIETLDALQLTGPVHLGGLSMGGYVALSIAERYPERVKALMLINTRAAGDSPESRREARGAGPRDRGVGRRRAAGRRLAGQDCSPSRRPRATRRSSTASTPT